LAMAVPFDHIASTYDSIFAPSAIGQLQRRHVWDYVERVMPELNGLEMLELNYGTGEDALMFSERGFNLVATDLSEELLKVTQHKKTQYSMQSKVTSQYVDVDGFGATTFNKKFDLIISNFGGVNCMHPEALKKLLKKLPSILAPGGRFIAVVMPRFCMWESVFFFFRLQFKKMFRRWTSSEVIDTLYGFPTKLWYYNPSQIKRWAKPYFTTLTTKPVGLVLPPSYLENFFSEHKRLLFRLNKFEKRLNRLSFYSGIADNYIIDLKLK
jgi:ubiquinone/menaquinone biosynthesis C-methylase UbiE